VAKFWLLVIAVIIILFVMRLAGNRNGKRRAPGNMEESGAPEEMVPCAVCGIHVPRSEARNAGHAYYCCEEHLHRSIG